MLRLVLSVFIGISLILSVVTKPPHSLPDETEPIRRFHRQTFFADRHTSGSILSNLLKRNTKIASGNRFRRQFTSSADGSTSGSILNNLWKRKAEEPSSHSNLADQRALRQSFPSVDDRSALDSILRSRLTRGTAEDGTNGRTKRQWNSVDSMTSGTILGNLWKRKVANSSNKQDSKPTMPAQFKTNQASDDRFNSGSSLSHRTPRETEENGPNRRAKRQWNSVDSLTSETILGNLWKRKVANSPSKQDSKPIGETSSSSLSHRTPRETAENMPKGDDGKVRATRQGYMSSGYTLIQWIPGGSLSSSSSTTMLNNLWKKRQALYYAEIPTFTNL